MKTTTIRFSLKTPKPRNPLVAAMRGRRAGAHGAAGGAAARRCGRAQLRRELHEPSIPHSP